MRAINESQRSMLEYLVEYGPADLDELRRAGLPMRSVNPLVRRGLVTMDNVLVRGGKYRIRLSSTPKGERKVSDEKRHFDRSHDPLGRWLQ